MACKVLNDFFTLTFPLPFLGILCLTHSVPAILASFVTLQTHYTLFLSLDFLLAVLLGLHLFTNIYIAYFLTFSRTLS